MGIKYKLSRQLVCKSKEAFLLGLELYNKPTIDYRAESFSLLFTNSWELLLKAHIYEKSYGKKTSIFRKKERNKKRQSISLDECLDKVFTNVNDPIKRNIEYISEVRNEAAHLVVQELYPFFSRVFQSGIFNYVKMLNDWFDININTDVGPGLISFVTDVGQISSIQLLKDKYSKEDAGVILGWIDKFQKLQQLGNKAAISFDFKIALMKNPKKADIVLSTGASGDISATVIEKQKDPDSTHPYSRSKAIELVRNRLPQATRFTTYDFEAYCFANSIKSANNDCYYKGKYSGAGQFSDKFINELVQAANPKTLKQWRSRYHQFLKNKSATKKV